MRLKGTPKGYRESSVVAEAYRKLAAKHGMPRGSKKKRKGRP